MTQNLQISKRLDDGTILVIGGDNYADFTSNLFALLSEEDAQEVLASFSHLASVPGVTGQAVQNLNQGGIPTQPYQHPATQVQAPPPVAPVAPPAAAGPVCDHGEPAKYVPGGVAKASGKPYRAFYACARGRDQQCGFRANG